MENAIVIDGLEKTYASGETPVRALDGVSFAIQRGEFFGLLGPNGAGKSTLINIIAGVTEKSGGRAEVAGIGIDQDHAAVKRRIGVVAQEISFDAFLTVDSALRYQFGYYGQQVDEGRLSWILAMLSLADKRHAKPRALSGGMKRRFMIAKALVHDPDILFLDEPTAGVDVELRHELYDLVRTLNDAGKTIILTSHYLEEVELLCERVAIINEGKLVAIDDKRALKARFQTERVLSIALTRPLDGVPGSLGRFSPELAGSSLRLRFQEDAYQEVLRAVADADLPVAHFNVIEPSLEDVFVSLTAKHHDV